MPEMSNETVQRSHKVQYLNFILGSVTHQQAQIKNLLIEGCAPGDPCLP